MSSESREGTCINPTCRRPLHNVYWESLDDRFCSDSCRLLWERAQTKNKKRGYQRQQKQRDRRKGLRNFR